MVLMTVTDINHKFIGRCDARCYDARKTKCHCVCFGKLHGIGQELAVAKIYQRLQIQTDADPLTTYLPKRKIKKPRQTSLFDMCAK